MFGLYRPRFFFRRRFYRPWFGPRFGLFRGFGCGIFGLLMFACLFGFLCLTLFARRF